MIKEKIKDILDEPLMGHPSQHERENIRKIIRCVEMLADRVDYLEGISSRSVKVKGRRNYKPKQK